MSNKKRTVRPILDEEIGRFRERLQETIGNESVLSFAERAGVSEGSVRNTLRSGAPRLDSLLMMARAGGVSVAWLATGEGPKHLGDLSEAEQRREDLYRAGAGDKDAADRTDANIKETGKRLRESREAADTAMAGKDLSPADIELVRSVAFSAPGAQHTLEDLVERLITDSAATELAHEFVLIPGYNVQVSTGHGAFPADEKPSRKLAFRRKWLKYRGLNEKNLVLVFARGDSMEPTISDNNTLMIDTSNTELSNGLIYVIRVNSHLVAKRVQTLTNRDIMLLSDNETYKPEVLKPEQLQDLAVIGKVVWIGKDV